MRKLNEKLQLVDPHAALVTIMRDRLQELQALSRKNSSRRGRSFRNRDEGYLIREANPDKLNAFERLHNDVEAIHSDLDELRVAVELVEKDHADMISSPVVDSDTKDR